MVSPTSAPDPSKSSPDGTFTTANEVDNANDELDTFPHLPLQLFVHMREEPATVNEVSPVVVKFSEQLEQQDRVCLPLNMGAKREEQGEEGDTNSVEDAEEIKQLTLSTEESLRERLSVLVKIEDDVDHLVKDSERNMYRLEGLESGTSYAKPPEDWKPPVVLAEGEPAFSNVDNPGGLG
jgi:hypothetical protein